MHSRPLSCSLQAAQPAAHAGDPDLPGLGASGRPIVAIGHSFGGLVLKQWMVELSQLAATSYVPFHGEAQAEACTAYPLSSSAALRAGGHAA